MSLVFQEDNFLINKKLKVITFLGTRPEIIKLSQVIRELDHVVHHIIVHTGQNFDYELNEVFFKDLGLRDVDHYLGCAGDTYAETIATLFVKTEALLKAEQPDAILIYGDTNSCLAAYIAKRMQIPIFHMEAGNRCFDSRVPEEINRKIIDHLSDVNMVLCQEAKENLLREGIRADRIFNVGSHLPEVIDRIKPKIKSSHVLQDLNLRGPYIVVSIHREENVDDFLTLKNIVNSINHVVEAMNVEAVLSCHPRLRLKLDAAAVQFDETRVKISKPLGFIDYLALQNSSLCVVSDSGTVSEEASILKIPAVTIRNSHERPEGMQDGVFCMSTQGAHLFEMIQYSIRDKSVSSIGDPYPKGSVSSSICKIVLSYIDQINQQSYLKI